jgi:xanthine dehydrogenase molybdopterin binding subunit/xanthine dehydrogenase small subunit
MKPVVTINGKATDVLQAGLHQSLLDYLRHHGQTGSKMGCNEGDCGACTVLLLEKEGPPRAINSCLALMGSLVGRSIITAEGLETQKGLHPVQQAMVEKNGSQCGYCTPGFICSMAEASARGVQNDSSAVADQLCGNLCRCTGYRPIREAMAQVPTTVLPSCHAGASAALPGYHLPQSVNEALALKSEMPAAAFIAGATEIAVVMNKRHARFPALISLDHIEELRGITATETHWHIGAAATLTDIEAELKGEYPALDAMLRRFASRQIRHRATLGGNLVTASPIGDSAPVLLALDATVTMRSAQSERTVLLHEFFTGYRKTILRDDELLTCISIQRKCPGETVFFKVSKRREMDISTVSAAIRWVLDGAGKIVEARLAYGGVAATPSRAVQTEAALVGLSVGEATSDDIVTLLVSEFTPLDDLRGSAAYRRQLIGELFRKALAGERDEIERPVEFLFDDTSPHSSAHESAVHHVTGRARYVDDNALGLGTLRLWPVCSPHAHAKFILGTLEAATRASGVHAVLTANDVPGLNNTGPARHDEPLFAVDGWVHYRGQMIAVVVADTEEQAREAAGLIPIHYEPLTPLLGIEAAIEAKSFHTDPHYLTRGEVDSALSSAVHRLSGSLSIGGQEHFYLETHAAMAMPDGEGGVFVQSSTQHPSEIQSIVAEVLHLPRHQVVVECPRMGGGFGGKETQGNVWAAATALAAMKTGRRVSIQLDRDLDMEFTGKRHPFWARFDVGFDNDGRLDAADVQLYSDGGWALDLSQPVNDRALFHLDNTYYIPHVRFRGQVCRTNATSHTAFRGFGGPQGMVVIEDIISRIASHRGLPAEVVRERNFYHSTGETNTTHFGEEIEDNRTQRIWRELLAASNFTARKQELSEWNASHPHRKRGLAITPVKFGISFTLKHYNQAGALVLVYADGSVQVNHGGTEMGQGLHTKILGVAMRELGLPADRIRLMHTRTDKVPNTSATAASSGSDLNGMAVADACRQLRERLTPLAASVLRCDTVTFADGQVFASDGKSMPFAELVAKAYTERIQLSAAGFYATPDLQWDWSVGKGKPFHYFAFGAAVSEVEIDGFTGMNHIRRVDILHDVGDSLNPAIDRGQIEGAFVQGAGWLTCEELKWNSEGRLLTHSASTYAIPAFSDAPLDFRVSLLKDAAQKSTIHGSKAVGEPPFMLAISVREALRDAVAAFGAKADDLPSPLTSEVVKLLVGTVR